MLRTEDLAQLVETKLSPIALRYGYSDFGLEERMRGRPLVLVLGNYSSGKSSLINELLGADVQETGQAPTDDAFTLLMHSPHQGRVDVREGEAALRDPQLPFHQLKQEGKRFAAHFRVKSLNAPLLESLSIIDTPGMLDSVAEKDRGYDYKSVVGALASLADLILVLFDPHRPGTVRETHELLREVLPVASSEDRTVFVLNRIDECASLKDLLRVYGTLCWNLSQMTGRKDIPSILLSHRADASPQAPFLQQLGNQRSELKQLVRDAPRHRVDHLVSYTENQTAQLEQFLEVVTGASRSRYRFVLKSLVQGLALSLLMAFVIWLAFQADLLPPWDDATIALFALGTFFTTALLWMLTSHRLRMRRFTALQAESLGQHTQLKHPRAQEIWTSVEEKARAYLQGRRGRGSLWGAARDLSRVRRFRRELTTLHSGNS